MTNTSKQDWGAYYKNALNTVRIELAKPLRDGENFSSRKAYILGYIEGALKEVHEKIVAYEDKEASPCYPKQLLLRR